MFMDIYSNYPRIFNHLVCRNYNREHEMFGWTNPLILDAISYGLIPRCYVDGENICEEYGEVDELVFVMSGIIGIGFQVIGNPAKGKNFIIAKK